MKIFLAASVFVVNLFGFTIAEQESNLKVAYEVGKTIVADDGTTFEHALATIMMNETSGGIFLIGDKYNKGKLKKIDKCSLGPFQVKLSTAKYLIRTYPRLKQYKRYLNNDKELINILLTETEKSAEIAGMYLLDRYQTAKRRNMSQPYWRAISAYNGGWNNTKYKRKFRHNLKFVKKVKAKNSWDNS